ncbi:MAG: virulence RhuM family protein [Bifidobacteriaceae bacterium]|jgi:hypothetical protein|nr:virulence RhuM family protein [Bifidobacteriaceae bacterium]
MTQGNGEVIVYRKAGGGVVQLRTGGGTVWLSYRDMADLYQTTSENIIQIVGRVLEDGEVDASTTNSELVVRQEGSRQAVLFRQWAATVLKGYLVKRFALDAERLKSPGAEPDYFDEVAERIRAIRAPERRFVRSSARVPASRVAV